MQNVSARIDGALLTITIDLDVEGSPSASGKSVLIASSRGAVSIPGRPDLSLNLNVMRPLAGSRPPRRTE